MTPPLCPVCPLCGGRSGEYAVISGRRLCACLAPDCGLFFTGEVPGPGDIAKLYSRILYDPADPKHRETPLLTSQSLLRALGVYETPAGSILDVGCGYGGLYGALPDGWRGDYAGIETDPYARHRAESQTGTRVFESISDALLNGGRRWSLVYMHQTVEHMADPRGDIAALKNLVASGGRMFVSTDNAGSAARAVWGLRWPPFREPTHLYFYNERSLRRLLRCAGWGKAERLKFPVAYGHMAPPRRAIQGVLRAAGFDGMLTMVVEP